MVNTEYIQSSATSVKRVDFDPGPYTPPMIESSTAVPSLKFLYNLKLLKRYYMVLGEIELIAVE
jgi:hypothetical protein